MVLHTHTHILKETHPKASDIIYVCPATITAPVSTHPSKVTLYEMQTVLFTPNAQVRKHLQEKKMTSTTNDINVTLKQ